MQGFLTALAFLTVLPIPFHQPPAPDTVARSRFWFPGAGLLLGSLLGAWTWLMTLLGSPAVAAFLVLLAWVVITGALHVDGFCDLCDGLFGGKTPEQRLQIMKDPHLGAFGLAGGVLLLLGKFVALQELLARFPAQAPIVVGLAVTVARCSILFLAAGSKYPRPEGTGKIIIESTRPGEAALHALIAIVVCVAGDLTVNAPIRTWPAVVIVLLILTALKGLCRHRLGGITGDSLGAGIELAECVFLLAAVLPGEPGA